MNGRLHNSGPNNEWLLPTAAPMRNGCLPVAQMDGWLPSGGPNEEWLPHNGGPNRWVAALTTAAQLMLSQSLDGDMWGQGQVKGKPTATFSLGLPSMRLRLAGTLLPYLSFTVDLFKGRWGSVGIGVSYGETYCYLLFRASQRVPRWYIASLSELHS